MDTDWQWLRADYASYLKMVAEANHPDRGIIGLSFGDWLRAQPKAYLAYHGLVLDDIAELELEAGGAWRPGGWDERRA